MKDTTEVNIAIVVVVCIMVISAVVLPWPVDLLMVFSGGLVGIALALMHREMVAPMQLPKFCSRLHDLGYHIKNLREAEGTEYIGVTVEKDDGGKQIEMWRPADEVLQTVIERVKEVQELES